MNSSTTMIQSWFIPIDIYMIICSSLIILISTIFLSIMIRDKTCHTVPMMLIANFCLSTLILGCILLGFAMFTYENDRKQIEYYDSFCIIRTYIAYIAYSELNFSIMLQATYRYICVVYPTRLFYQSYKFQFICICLTWIYSFIYSIPFISTGKIVYNIDNQMCQLPLELSVLIIYEAFSAFTLPISLVILIYWKLIRYIQNMRKNVTPVNTIIRAQNQLKMVKQTVILIMVLIAICFPYTVIMIMSFFTSPPRYHFRIIFISLDTAVLSCIIILLRFTEPLKLSLMKVFNIQIRTIVPTIT